MSASLNMDHLETVANLNHDWLIYATVKPLFFDRRDFSRVKAGTCVGVRFERGGIVEKVFFKHVFTSTENPHTLKKAFQKSERLNIQEGRVPQQSDDLDYFLQSETPEAQRSGSPPNYIELQNDLQNE